MSIRTSVRCVTLLDECNRLFTCVTGICWTRDGMTSGKSMLTPGTKIPLLIRGRSTTLSFLKVSQTRVSLKPWLSCFFVDVYSKSALLLNSEADLKIFMCFLQIWIPITWRSDWWRMKTLSWSRQKPGTNCCRGMRWWMTSLPWRERSCYYECLHEMFVFVSFFQNVISSDIFSFPGHWPSQHC